MAGSKSIMFESTYLCYENQIHTKASNLNTDTCLSKAFLFYIVYFIGLFLIADKGKSAVFINANQHLVKLFCYYWTLVGKHYITYQTNKEQSHLKSYKPAFIF